MTLLKQFLEAMTYINKMSNFECIVDKVHRDLKPDNVLLDEN
jgi:serine/threonine protein kinase